MISCWDMPCRRRTSLRVGAEGFIARMDEESDVTKMINNDLFTMHLVSLWVFRARPDASSSSAVNTCLELACLPKPWRRQVEGYLSSARRQSSTSSDRAH